jgi:hypothetical protein
MKRAIPRPALTPSESHSSHRSRSGATQKVTYVQTLGCAPNPRESRCPILWRLPDAEGLRQTGQTQLAAKGISPPQWRHRERIRSCWTLAHSRRRRGKPNATVLSWPLSNLPKCLIRDALGRQNRDTRIPTAVPCLGHLMAARLGTGQSQPNAGGPGQCQQPARAIFPHRCRVQARTHLGRPEAPASPGRPTAVPEGPRTEFRKARHGHPVRTPARWRCLVAGTKPQPELTRTQTAEPIMAMGLPTQSTAARN